MCIKNKNSFCFPVGTIIVPLRSFQLFLFVSVRSIWWPHDVLDVLGLGVWDLVPKQHVSSGIHPATCLINTPNGWASSAVVKRPKRETARSPPPRTKAKNKCSCTSTPHTLSWWARSQLYLHFNFHSFFRGVHYNLWYALIINSLWIFSQHEHFRQYICSGYGPCSVIQLGNGNSWAANMSRRKASTGQKPPSCLVHDKL